MSDLYHCPPEVNAHRNSSRLHEWQSDVWGIYCTFCGEMRVIPKDGDFNEAGHDQEPEQQFFDGKH